MASALYPSFKQLLLGGDIDLVTDTIRMVLLDNTYVFSSAHDFRNDLIGVIHNPSDALTSKVITSGVLDAANGLVSSVPSGSTVVAVAMYKDTGLASTDPLILFLDGLSLATNGNNINLVFNASGIFAL